MAKYALTRKNGEEVIAKNELELQLWVANRNNPIIGVKKMQEPTIQAKKATCLGRPSASMLRRIG